MEWVLLRGWVREKKHWSGFDRLFEEKIAGTKCICLDLPGIGDNEGLKSPFDVAAITDILRGQLASKSQQKPRGLLGISLGGMIAIDWATRFPEDFEQLVIINSSASNLSSMPERINFSIFLQALKIIFGHSAEQRERAILKLSSNKFEKPPYKAGSLPLGTAFRQLIAATRFKVTEKLSLPSLFLVSEKDRLVNSSCGVELARVIGAQVVTHPSAGHDLPLDDPEWVIEQIQKWSSNKI